MGRSHYYGIICAISCGAALCVAAILAPSRLSLAQNATARGLLLRAHETPPSSGGSGDPLAALPNYAAAAKTLLHWRQPEVVFHVTPSRNDNRTPAEVRALVAQGLYLWKNRISSKLKLRLTENPDEFADVEISFVAANSFPAGQVGNTDLQYARAKPPKDDIAAAKIQVADGLSNENLVADIAHECGHVLGIAGHSDAVADLMYAALHAPAAVTDRDANTLNMGYYRIDTGSKRRSFERGQQFDIVKIY